MYCIKWEEFNSICTILGLNICKITGIRVDAFHGCSYFLGQYAPDKREQAFLPHAVRPIHGIHGLSHIFSFEMLQKHNFSMYIAIIS